MSENETTGPIGLHELSPAPGSRRPRKRIGRGTGSGTGKTSGRGQKGQKSRSGSHMMRAGFEGGQNPLYMLLGKQRGPHKKTSMPFGPFRTQTTGVNLRDIARRFESGADVTPEAMLAARVVRTLRHPVKVLGVGEVPGPMNVSAHGFSASARQKIEAAGGTATVIEELVEAVETVVIATTAPVAEGPWPLSPSPTSPSTIEDVVARRSRTRKRRAGGRRGSRRRGRGLVSMLLALLGSWRVPELRKRLLFTAGIIALYRAGSYLPVPGVQTDALKNFFGGSNNTILSVLNLFSGGALANLSLFALGIMPYITASIILQLMTVAVPALEQLQKEGEAGYKKITQYTRYLTVGLAALQASGYVFLFHNGSAIGASDLLPESDGRALPADRRAR